MTASYFWGRKAVEKPSIRFSSCSKRETHRLAQKHYWFLSFIKIFWNNKFALLLGKYLAFFALQSSCVKIPVHLFSCCLGGAPAGQVAQEILGAWRRAFACHAFDQQSKASKQTEIQAGQRGLCGRTRETGSGESSIPWTSFYHPGEFDECILNAGHWPRARITEGNKLDTVGPAWRLWPWDRQAEIKENDAKWMHDRKL